MPPTPGIPMGVASCKQTCAYTCMHAHGLHVESMYLPDRKRLRVHDGGLDNLLSWEDTPGHSIHICGAQVRDHVALGVHGHVCDAGGRLQLWLQGPEVLWRGEELHVGLLIHIPARTQHLSKWSSLSCFLSHICSLLRQHQPPTPLVHGMCQGVRPYVAFQLLDCADRLVDSHESHPIWAA